LYRAVDSEGNTIDCMLSPHRDLIAAKYFLQLALCRTKPIRPRVINVDGLPAYARAITELKEAANLCQGRVFADLEALRSGSKPQKADFRHPPKPQGSALLPIPARLRPACPHIQNHRLTICSGLGFPHNPLETDSTSLRRQLLHLDALRPRLFLQRIFFRHAQHFADGVVKSFRFSDWWC
jgi:hypothetical protein